MTRHQEPYSSGLNHSSGEIVGGRSQQNIHITPLSAMGEDGCQHQHQENMQSCSPFQPVMELDQSHLLSQNQTSGSLMERQMRDVAQRLLSQVKPDLLQLLQDRIREAVLQLQGSGIKDQGTIVKILENKASSLLPESLLSLESHKGRNNQLNFISTKSEALFSSQCMQVISESSEVDPSNEKQDKNISIQEQYFDQQRAQTLPTGRENQTVHSVQHKDKVNFIKEIFSNRDQPRFNLLGQKEQKSKERNQLKQVEHFKVTFAHNSNFSGSQNQIQLDNTQPKAQNAQSVLQREISKQRPSDAYEICSSRRVQELQNPKLSKKLYSDETSKTLIVENPPHLKTETDLKQTSDPSQRSIKSFMPIKTTKSFSQTLRQPRQNTIQSEDPYMNMCQTNLSFPLQNLLDSQNHHLYTKTTKSQKSHKSFQSNSDKQSSQKNKNHQGRQTIMSQNSDLQEEIGDDFCPTQDLRNYNALQEDVVQTNASDEEMRRSPEIIFQPSAHEHLLRLQEQSPVNHFKGDFDPQQSPINQQQFLNPSLQSHCVGDIHNQTSMKATEYPQQVLTTDYSDKCMNININDHSLDQHEVMDDDTKHGTVKHQARGVQKKRKNVRTKTTSSKASRKSRSKSKRKSSKSPNLTHFGLIYDPNVKQMIKKWDIKRLSHQEILSPRSFDKITGRKEKEKMPIKPYRGFKKRQNSDQTRTLRRGSFTFRSLQSMANHPILKALDQTDFATQVPPELPQLTRNNCRIQQQSGGRKPVTTGSVCTTPKPHQSKSCISLSHRLHDRMLKSLNKIESVHNKATQNLKQILDYKVDKLEQDYKQKLQTKKTEFSKEVRFEKHRSDLHMKRANKFKSQLMELDGKLDGEKAKNVKLQRQIQSARAVVNSLKVVQSRKYTQLVNETKKQEGLMTQSKVKSNSSLKRVKSQNMRGFSFISPSIPRNNHNFLRNNRSLTPKFTNYLANTDFKNIATVSSSKHAQMVINDFDGVDVVGKDHSSCLLDNNHDNGSLTQTLDRLREEPLVAEANQNRNSMFSCFKCKQAKSKRLRDGGDELLCDTCQFNSKVMDRMKKIQEPDSLATTIVTWDSSDLDPQYKTVTMRNEQNVTSQSRLQLVSQQLIANKERLERIQQILYVSKYSSQQKEPDCQRHDQISCTIPEMLQRLKEQKRKLM